MPSMAQVDYNLHSRFLRTYLRPELPKLILVLALLSAEIGLSLYSPQIISEFIEFVYANWQQGPNAESAGRKSDEQ